MHICDPDRKDRPSRSSIQNEYKMPQREHKGERRQSKRSRQYDHCCIHKPEIRMVAFKPQPSSYLELGLSLTRLIHAPVYFYFLSSAGSRYYLETRQKSKPLTRCHREDTYEDITRLVRLPRKSTGIPLNGSNAIDAHDANATKKSLSINRESRWHDSKTKDALPLKNRHNLRLQHHLKELVPWLLERRPIGSVSHPTNLPYSPFLPKPVSLAPWSSKIDRIKLEYDSVCPKRFLPIQPLDGVRETG